jgi:hypothetical protein
LISIEHSYVAGLKQRGMHAPRLAGQSPTETALPSLKPTNVGIRSGLHHHHSPCNAERESGDGSGLSHH